MVTGIRAHRMRQAILAEIPVTKLKIINNSQYHRNHSGDDGSGESHFLIQCQSSAFNGKSQIECHRLMYKILQAEFATAIHALQLQLLPDPGHKQSAQPD